MGSGAREIGDSLKFLDEIDGGVKVFEVEWRQSVTWYVAAKSKDEARIAAQLEPIENVYDDEFLDISVNARDGFSPDMGVFGGKIICVDEYVAQKVWGLICKAAGSSIRCRACGSESWIDDCNLSPKSKPPKFGYLPDLGCPDCGVRIDWKRLIKEGEAIPVQG